MKKLLPGAWLVVLLALAPCAGAAEAEKPAAAPVAAGHYVSADAIDWKTVQPPPPAPGSIAALGDLETILQLQASRTPADIAWAKLVEKDRVFDDYSDVLGGWFAEKNLPVTARLLGDVMADTNLLNKKVKDLYKRARPPAVEPTVKPCVAIPTSNSYPSGHALRAFVWAAVLGDIFPDRQPDLFARAHRVAWGRVIGWVHFPSDVAGGRVAAQAIVAELRKNPAYRAEIEKCRAEVAPYLLKKAA